MAVRYHAIAKTGTYTAKDGTEKTSWTRCGIVVDTKNGGLALKIEQLPVPFDGWLNFALPKDETQPSSQAPAPQAGNESDEVPF
jgi:hypothetical protein